MGSIRFPLLDTITGKIKPDYIPDLSGDYAPVPAGGDAVGSVPTKKSDGTLAYLPSLPINVAAYGAVGDWNGTTGTDDTTALTNAFAAWMTALQAGKAAHLVFAPGKRYRTTDTITLSPSGVTIVAVGRIEMHGAQIVLTNAAVETALLIKTKGTGQGWQMLDLAGVNVRGGNVWLYAGSNSEFIWDAQLDDLHVVGAKRAPLRLTNGVFESAVNAPFLEFDPSTTPTGDDQSCIFVEKESGQSQPSSIDIVNPTTRGGYIGIRSPNAADVKVTGGTILAAQREGIFLVGNGCHVKGVHAEDNWLSGASTDAAAVRIEGSGSVRDLFTIANTAASQAPYSGSTSQNYAVRCYAYSTDISGGVIAGALVVDNVTHQTNVPGAKDLRCTGGQSGSSVIMSGVGSRTLTAITNGRFIDHDRGRLDTVAATVTASGTAVVHQHNPGDATSGAVSLALPTGQLRSSLISIEKVDSSANAVNVTGSIRGVGASSISLTLAHEALLLIADDAGSWWPIAGHKTIASLDTHNDARYLALVPSADIDANSHKVKNLAAGTAASDAARIDQIKGTSTKITATNATWPIPVGATLLRITAVGGGGQGGGAGSAAAAQLQTGGAGGAAGTASTQVVSVGANTTLNVTIGAGGSAAGVGGAAGGNAGTTGTVGGDTTVTATGISVTGKGGTSGAGSAASSTATVNGGLYGSNFVRATVVTAGSGGQSNIAGGHPVGDSPGGGAGGGTATTTLGGGAGGTGSAISAGLAPGGNSGTSAGVDGAAATDLGAGGGGGGGGAAGTGKGGNGGAGAAGFVLIQVVG